MIREKLRNLFRKKRKVSPDDSGIDTTGIRYIDPDDVIAACMTEREKWVITCAVEMWNSQQLQYYVI